MSVVVQPVGENAQTDGAAETDQARSNRAADVFRRRPLLFGSLLITTLALAATTLHARGLVMADARYEHVADPIQYLARHAYIWDDQRGTGNPTIFFSPVVSSVQATLQLVGVAPWLIGRLTLAVYLALAGSGAMLLALRLRRERPVLALLAGLIYAFGPFSSQYMFPSGLYLPSALLPWIMVLILDGLTNRSKLRCGALIALLLFAVGLLNTASLVLAMIPAALFAIFLVCVERQATWRDLGKLAAAVFVPLALISSAMLTVLWFSLPVVDRNLPTTERPRTAAATTSASEAWRGLGQWLSYFRIGGPPRPSAARYFIQPAVVATYVTPILAMVGLAFGKLRARLTLGLIAALLVFVVVGAHRPDTGPLSWAFNELFTGSDSSRAFRTTFKAVPGVWLALSVLAPFGLEAIVRAIRRPTGRRWLRTTGSSLVALTAVTAFTVSAHPFISGSLFNEADTFRELPGYWEEFFEDMESVDADSRVLALPGVARARYEWGYVNDSLLNAHLRPQAMMAQTIPITTPDLTRIVEDLDRRIIEDDVEPEAVAPMLRAADIEWVLVQNDLLTSDGQIQPDTVEELRTAPGVELAATYGARLDLRPALELYYVSDSTAEFTFWETPPLIVSGASDAFAPLARHGFLDGPTVNLAQLDDQQLELLIDRGAHVVVTDGSRRRATQASSSRLSESQTLYGDETTDRPILTVDPDDTATQSYVTADNIEVIEASRTDWAGNVWSPENRAGLAFDGDPDTHWSVGQLLGTAVGETISLRLSEPVDISAVAVTLPPYEQQITRLEVELADGSGELTFDEIEFDDPVERTVSLDVDAQVSSVTLRIEEVSDGLGGVGISEIELRTADGTAVDTREFVQVPTEVDRLTGVAGVNISYVFGRPDNPGEEPTMRRRFDVVDSDEFRVRARIAAPRRRDTDACFPVGTLDGEPLEMKTDPDAADTPRSRRDLVGCDELELGVGSHEFVEDVGFGGGLIDLAFVSSNRDPAISAPLAWERNDTNNYEVELPPEAGFLVSPIPEHEGWVYDGDGRLSERLVIDGHTGWVVEEGSTVTATARFAPHRIYQVALLITALTIAWCLFAAWRWRSR